MPTAGKTPNSGPTVAGSHPPFSGVDGAAFATEPAVRRSPSLLPVLLLFLSIISLATITSFIQARNRRLQREINEVLVPASTAAMEAETGIARQMAAWHALARTGNREYLAAYYTALAQEQTALRALTPLVPRFHSGVGQRLDTLVALLEKWNTTVRPTDAPRADETPAAAHRRVDAEQTLYRQTLNAATSLASAITDVEIQRRREIDAAERLDWRFTLVLCITALFAGGVLLWLDHRSRMFAAAAERRRREVERLMESRAGLMRGLTHDIRNPLGSVDGYVYVLQSGMKGDLNAQQRDVLRRIQRSVRSSLDLLESVIELSRTETDRLSIRLQEVDLAVLLHEIVEDAAEFADKKELLLESHIPAALPVTTDAGRVRRVVENLVSNAIKYTPAGGTVSVVAALEQRADPPRDWITIQVRDSGIGIPEADRERIFEEFFRVEGAEQHASGLGVGLAISRRMARMLGGDLTVSSVEARGSNFQFSWPCATPDERPAQHKQSG